MKQISLNTDWEFYESDESMSFVFQRPEAVTVNLPHDFIITKPRSPQAAGGPENRDCREERRAAARICGGSCCIGKTVHYYEPGILLSEFRKKNYTAAACIAGSGCSCIPIYCISLRIRLH